MTGHGILAKVLDLIVTHAIEIIISGIVLADVIDAKQKEFAVTAPTLGRAMAAGLGAALPFARRAFSWRLRRLSLGALITADANAIEVF